MGGREACCVLSCALSPVLGTLRGCAMADESHRTCFLPSEALPPSPLPQQSRRGREELSARLEPGSSVAHIHARLSFRERSAQLVFLPVHAIAYAWGETFNVHSERVPDTYMALVSGGGGASPESWGAGGW